MYRSLLAGLLAITLWSPLAAYAEGQPAGIDMSGIQDMTTLPTSGLKIIATKRGLIAVTSNGRWAIRGTIYDTWQMRSFDTIEGVRRAANHIRLDQMKIEIDTLDPLVIGSDGHPEVVVFVDPMCDSCAGLIRQMQPLSDQYVFKILPIGVQSKQSANLVKTVGCAPDRQAAINALSSHDYSGLKPKSDCDLSALRHALITAQVFGVNNLPFLIAPDGFVRQSAPDDLQSWLKDHQQ